MAEKQYPIDPASSDDNGNALDAAVHDYPPLEATPKTKGQKLLPTFACGAGLFSDGYLQSVIGPVSTCLTGIYGDAYTESRAKQNVTSIAFVGTVVGQLVFGYTSDTYSRKWSLFISTCILFLFAILCTGAWGAGGSAGGLFAALTAYRFFLGIGIGGEYPAGSVACAESTGELKEGTRNRWFCLFTNTQIDIGFVFGSLVPMIVAAITSDLTVVWRVSLGIGIIPPLSLLYFRYRLDEPESYSRETFNRTKTPYWLAFKLYWPRLLCVMGIWFIYDFLTYPFSIYSSAWIEAIEPNYNTWQSFGWSTLINFFYVPGAIFGSFTSDWIGPRRALYIFVIVQAILGFIMTASYEYLRETKFVGAFVVLYGLFLAVGEMGPGDNIGLLASKTSATGIRGRYYAIAAATGKIGGFIGNYIFPIIQDAGGSSTSLNYGRYPFYVAGSLCFVSAFLAWCLPEVNQDTIEREDIRFREFLQAHGYDTTKMGNEEWSERRHSIAVGQKE